MCICEYKRKYSIFEVEVFFFKISKIEIKTFYFKLLWIVIFVELKLFLEIICIWSMNSTYRTVSNVYENGIEVLLFSWLCFFLKVNYMYIICIFSQCYWWYTGYEL